MKRKGLKHFLWVPCWADHLQWRHRSLNQVKLEPCLASGSYKASGQSRLGCAVFRAVSTGAWDSFLRAAQHVHLPQLLLGIELNWPLCSVFPKKPALLKTASATGSTLLMTISTGSVIPIGRRPLGLGRSMTTTEPVRIDVSMSFVFFVCALCFVCLFVCLSNM